MKIGDLAKTTGVNIETIRYYQRKGILDKPQKPLNGYREYTEKSAVTVKFIKNAQKLGFSLYEIKELLSLRVDPESDCNEVKLRAIAKIEEIEAKIKVLENMKQSLTEITNKCSGIGVTSTCNILNALDSEDLS